MNWHKFHAQNQVIREFLLTHYPMVVQIDIKTPTVLRVDSHMDGMHYCIPGPIDTWVKLMYNALQIVHKAQSFDSMELCMKA